jgi:calcineurin-like phosphoesterase family protein
MTIWFTADQHYDHTSIISYTGRPFANKEEMNETIIKRYNKVVKDGDTVYFLGDLSMYYDETDWLKLARYIQQLKGRKILIQGNHDRFNPFAYVEMGFESVHTSLVETFEGKPYVMVHDPSVACDVRGIFKFICGHVHGLFKKQKGCLNVGVDVWNYYPVKLEDVIKELNE